MADSDSKTYLKILIALSLVHFSSDFYNSFMSPLLPVFADKMGLSLAFETGGILAPIVGKMGDIFTIQSVLMLLVCIPVLSLIPILYMPEVNSLINDDS